MGHHFIRGHKDEQRLFDALKDMYFEAAIDPAKAVALQLAAAFANSPERVAAVEPCPEKIIDLPKGQEDVKGNCAECIERVIIPLFAKTYGVDNPLAVPLPASDNVIDVDFRKEP